MSRVLHLTEGQPTPLGAHSDGDGVNVAVFSKHAIAIELCVFDPDGRDELARLPLPGRTGDVFHGRLEGARSGLVYGLRAHGPWQPQAGHKFNPAKLLLDPYAREVVGRFEWRDEHVGHDPRDNAAFALKARVVDEVHEAHLPLRPALRTPIADTVLYEVHVKGFSRTNAEIPTPLRGTYAALAHKASIAHFKRLGVTALSLLPVHQHIDEQRLVAMGLRNYWGYNTIAYFCPDSRYASGAGRRSARDEFRAMVDTLHANGIEVILDVVFNHTAETDELGPTVSFRGLDNASYYRLRGDDRALYENHAGCGNTLDLRQPRVLQFVLDSLRHWVQALHVDGFRFDLATVLARGDDGFDDHAAFLMAVAQDPVLSRVKLIAEPWDLGPGGYRLGQFPAGWLEWNDRFRDTMRGFWFTRRATRGEWAQRLCGSSDLFQHDGRAPSASVNYVVSHDGFTLRDAVSYERRHNEANGEDNRDGHAHNLSTNAGHEGLSDNPQVNARRSALQRAMLATLLLSQGTPMLCAGDELGHTQHGNNNPYCQDNETTWIAWARADPDLIAFTAKVIALRKRRRPFADRWYLGNEIEWLDAHGTPLSGPTWNDGNDRALTCMVRRPACGAHAVLLLVNANDTAMRFTLPEGRWTALLDTAHAHGEAAALATDTRTVTLEASSLQLYAAHAATADSEETTAP